jgi:type IV pilus assembly protein PilO
VTNRNILILGALGIVVLLVAYYFLLLSPLLGRLDEQSKARQDKQAQLAQVQQDVNKLEEVRRNSPEIQRQLLELSKRIPAQPQIPTFVVQAEEVADASGVTQLTVDPEPAGSPEGGGDYQVVPVTMQFQGTYDEMQDFLLRTRNLARLVTVTKITYCRSGGSDTAGAAGDTESSITCPAATTSGGEGETTTPNPSAETLLDVEIEADIYFQPTDATSGQAPPTVVPESTTPEQPAETTSGG